MGWRTRLIWVVAGITLMSTGIAAASDLCHQDLPGSRLLVLDAKVSGYRFAGNRAVVHWSRSAACSGTTTWDFAARTRTDLSTSCHGTGIRDLRPPLKQLRAADSAHLIRVIAAPVSSDRPDRLLVVDRRSGRRVAVWPLFERPARVALHGDVALLSGASRHALYALRISDGRLALIGITRAGDRPVIGPAGSCLTRTTSTRSATASPHPSGFRISFLCPPCAMSSDGRSTLSARSCRTRRLRSRSARSSGARRTALGPRGSQSLLIGAPTPPERSLVTP